MSSLCVTTAYTQDWDRMGRICGLSLMKYATRHPDCTAKIFRGTFTKRRPPWAKINLILKLFDDGYDWVLWVDADAFFCRFDLNIRSETAPSADLYLVQHDVPGWTSPAPNTGVALWRNCQWSRDLLAAMWKIKRPRRWTDNGALIELIGYHDLFRDGSPHQPNEKLLRRIKFLSTDWNYVPGTCEGGNPIIKHFAGWDRSIRPDALASDAADAGLL